MARKKKQDHDFSVTAFRVVQRATGQAETKLEKKETTKAKRDFDPVALGHLGGMKGGKARAKKLTSEQRSEIAKKAAKARWGRE